MCGDGPTLVATHARAERGRVTRLEHYPPAGRIFLTNSPEACLAQTRAIGTAAAGVIDGLLAEATQTRLREAQAVLRLVERYPAARLERACARALAAEDGRLRTVRAILERELDAVPADDVPAAASGAFLRGPAAFGAEVVP